MTRTHPHLVRAFTVLALVILTASSLGAERARREELPDGRVRTSGLVTPHEGRAFLLRNLDGRTVVRVTDQTRVAIDVNYRQVGNVQGRALRFETQWEGLPVNLPLPEGQLYARKTVRPQMAEKELDAATKETWLSARGLSIHGTPQADHQPTRDEPFFAGRWQFARGRGKPATLTVGDTALEVSMKKGGQTNILIYDAIGPDTIEPHVYRATVIGKEADGALVADEVHLLPIGDQASTDKPGLPRYLCIGDSISYNYGKALREALAGKANVHHPPTNCGPSGKGAGNIVEWLGAYDLEGRGWNVISINFGHWDAGNTKAAYQENLEFAIRHMQKTGAKLIWVTTCPVPNGCGKAGDLGATGKAPGRKAGVMQTYLNPWALEVMKRHPAITVCDQWQLVRTNPDGHFTEWWNGNNVHFGSEASASLGRLLSQHVLEALGNSADK